MDRPPDAYTYILSFAIGTWTVNLIIILACALVYPCATTEMKETVYLSA